MRTFLTLNKSIVKQNCLFVMLLLTFLIFSSLAEAQIFVKVTDTNNPVVTANTDFNYSGAAWIDIDNDGDVDLYTTKDFLFRNLGGGNFASVTGFHSLTQPHLGNGTSWADFDNDGDPDLFLAAKTSLVYINDGTGNFEAILDSPLGENDDNRGWTGAWGDYNNDGFVDLVITHPAGFIGSPSIPSRFFENNGDGRFTRIDSFEFTTLLAPYTVSTWSDYDLDGDYDLFIGSGPAGTPARDYLYDNTLMKTSVAGFDRINTSPIGTDLQDGQVWNWIDYDNDGDLDAMLTNYGGAINRFYKNNDGTYESISNSLTVSGSYLGNSWGDIDNDGDPDVILTHENAAQVFINDGGDVFTLQSTFSGSARSTALGDYDDDGDLDMFISGGGGAAKGLYLNTNANGNNWVNFTLAGSISNKSAIGTKVRLKATISGTDTWQFREVSAQNNFNGHNSLRVHFGLGDAAVIDSVIIYWLSGETTILTNQNVNQFYMVEEDIPAGYLSSNFSADVIEGDVPLTVNFSDLSIADPNMPITSWEWDFDNDGFVDATTQNPSFDYSTPGTYSVSLKVTSSGSNDTRVRIDYIVVNPATDVELSHNSVPNNYSLSQNYPNPFNPETKISFSIPIESYVTLKVYDLLGSEVAELINEKKEPGFYELNFGGEKLPSGLYVYRIEAGDFISSKKMVLLK